MFTLRSIAAGCRGVVVLVCIVVATAGAARAATWSNVTVTTTDGWEYPDMTVVSTAGEPAILLVNGQGGRKSMPRASIRAIVDPAGRDVTEEIFAGTEPDHGEFIRPPAAEPEPSVTTSARRRDWRRRGALPARVLVLPSLSLGASGSGGDAFEALHGGGSLGFGLRITAVKNAYIGFDYRRQWLDFNSYSGSYYGGFGDASLDELYFVVGAHPRAVWLDRPITFVEVGVGAVFQNSGSYFATDFNNGGYYPGFFNDTKLGVLFAGGVLLPLSHSVPGVAIHIGADVRLTGADGTYGNRAGMLYGLTAGFTFLLGDSR